MKWQKDKVLHCISIFHRKKIELTQILISKGVGWINIHTMMNSAATENDEKCSLYSPMEWFFLDLGI